MTAGLKTDSIETDHQGNCAVNREILTNERQKKTGPNSDMKLTLLPNRQWTSSEDITKTGLMTAILTFEVFLLTSMLHKHTRAG